MGAKMGPSLTDPFFLNRPTASGAGLPFASIDLKIVLKFTPPINPIQAGAELYDALPEHFLNGVV
jgi:hypothetical protein